MKELNILWVIAAAFSIFGVASSQILGIREGNACVMKDGVTNGVCTLDIKCEYAKQMNREGKLKEVPICSFSGANDIILCCPQDDKSKSEKYCDLIQKQPIAQILPEVDHQIFNGIPAYKREFPHMVAIGYEVKNEILYLCGGALISRSWVITASHCLKTGMKTIRVGAVNTMINQSKELPQNIEIKRLVKHPDYRATSKYNDIALLELKSPVRTDDGIVKPICLPSLAMTSENDDYIIAGWGLVNNTHRSNRLLKAGVLEHSHDICVDKFKHFINNNDEFNKGIVSSQICAENVSNKSDTCRGDSGNPMFFKDEDTFYIRGVTSFGLPGSCGGSGGAPGIYTKVDAYLPWIESIVWPNEVIF